MQEPTNTGKDYTGTDLITQRETIVQQLLTITPGTPCAIFDKTEDPAISHDLAILVIKALDINYDINQNKMNKRLFLSYWEDTAASLNETRTRKLNAAPDDKFTVIEMKENFTRPVYNDITATIEHTDAPAEAQTPDNPTTPPQFEGTAIEELYANLYEPVLKYAQYVRRLQNPDPHKLTAALKLVNEYSHSFIKASRNEATAARIQRTERSEAQNQTNRKYAHNDRTAYTEETSTTTPGEAPEQTSPATALIVEDAQLTDSGYIRMTIQTAAIQPKNIILSMDNRIALAVREVETHPDDNTFYITAAAIKPLQGTREHYLFTKGKTTKILTSFYHYTQNLV